jgi:DNA polymerase-3 subunit delta
MAKPTPTTYLIHGDDDFGVEQEARALRERMSDSPNAELNTSEFDGETASAAEIISAASSYPFLADKRLVIVKGMLAHITRKGAGETGKKAVEQLLDALPNLPDTARLVFIERQTLSDSNKILKLIRESGYEKLAAAPNDATGWVVRRAQEAYGSTITGRAAAALASVTANDLRRADNELAKLASYVNSERPIDEDDVALLTPYLAEAKGFDMVDALATGRADQAMTMLNRLLMEKDEDPFRVYGLIIRQFRLLLLAKEHVAGGGNAKSFAQAQKLHEFPARKAVEQSRSFTLPQLEAIYRRLLDTDTRMKTGRLEPRLALDLLIASLGGR